MSKIRLSFVIIAKSYSTTCVIWHDNNCSESFPLHLMPGHVLVPVSLHPGDMAALTLKWSVGPVFHILNYFLSCDSELLETKITLISQIQYMIKKTLPLLFWYLLMQR